MSFLISGTSIHREPLIKLARSVSHDREGLLQLLLDISEKSTFGRIIRCPTYPIRVTTKDLAEKNRLFKETISSNSHDVSYALAFLYNAATEISYRKSQGQFFTPPYVSRMALAKLAVKRGERILDPGCGTGAFPVTLLKESRKGSHNLISISYLGIENDPLLALCTAVALDYVNAPINWRVLYANYLNLRTEDLRRVIGEEDNIDAIVSNPPYVRFHNLGERTELAIRLGLPKFSGLHSFFLEQSFRVAGKSRMVFIIPLEMNRTTYGAAQLERLRNSFKLEDEVIFYDAKNNIWKKSLSNRISVNMHAEIRHAWNLMSFRPVPKKNPELYFYQNSSHKDYSSVSLDFLASIHRGISTGANDYFVIDDKSAGELRILGNGIFLKKIMPTKIAKARLKNVLDSDDWLRLRQENRPCWLLSLPKDKSAEKFPIEIRNYIREGESRGIHLIPTCKNREPWYYVRIPPNPPNLFFTYISRGLPKFIYNKARVYNLTNLLGVYLQVTHVSDRQMEELTEVLNTDLVKWIKTRPVGRRYQYGLIKFEPRDLNCMPISKSSLKDLGLYLIK